MKNSYRTNGVPTSSREAARMEVNAKLEDFYSRGGKITKCPAGPSEGIVSRFGGRQRNKQQQQPQQPAESKDSEPKADES